MAQVINTNVLSINAQRNLSTSQSLLATSLQRLSSGLRINSAKDDAAGHRHRGAERERRLAALGDRERVDLRGGEVAAALGRHEHGGELERGRVAVAQAAHARHPRRALRRRLAFRRGRERVVAHARREEQQREPDAEPREPAGRQSAKSSG